MQGYKWSQSLFLQDFAVGQSSSVDCHCLAFWNKFKVPGAQIATSSATRTYPDVYCTHESTPPGQEADPL